MTRELWIELGITVVKILVIFNVLLGLFSLMTWVERRTLAFMQFRLGPNRTGWFGILQPVADGIKLFFKEEFIPEGANKWLFIAAPALSVITAFLAIAVVPYGGTVHIFGRDITLQIADLSVGVLFIFAVTALGVYGIVMAGWAANNKYSLLGGLRSSAQMFSYELALGLSWVGVIMLAGSFRLQDIVASQAGWFWNWSCFVQFPAFIVYVIAATAEVNRTPFDLAEAETELVAGFHTEYSSMKFALLQMAEYINMITVAALGTNLFLGGWNSGLPLFLPSTGFLGVIWFALKMLSVLFFFIWLRGTLPRFRYDQLMHFGWKVLVPVATVWILLTAGAVAYKEARNLSTPTPVSLPAAES
jgi:NADH-quinone oxidoreductase subunit H